MFKIEDLSLAETTEMLLKHPITDEVLGEDEGKPVTFTLFGTSSAKYRVAVDKMMRKRNQRGKREPTPAEMRADSVEFLANLSVKVENMEYKGAAVDSYDAFVALYGDESLSWIRDQINATVGSVESFLKG